MTAFATLVKDVSQISSKVWQVYGEPPLCPEYQSWYSQWGYVTSAVPPEVGDIIILRPHDTESEHFIRILDEQFT